MTTLVKAPPLTAESLYEQIKELPQESLAEVSRFVEFLHFKVEREQSEANSEVEKKLSAPIHIRDLEGILEGYDFSPEFIAETRREMWKNYDEMEV